MRIIELTEEARTNILENLLKRSPNSYGEFEGRVNEIIENVRANRDAAIFDYTKRFDGADINAENILVTEDEIKEAYEKVDEKLLTVIRKALVNIRKYHEKQRQYSWFDSEESGIILGQKVTALEKVGVLCTGRKGSLSVLRAYEHRSGKGCGCKNYRYDNTSRKRRKSQSGDLSCGKRGRCGCNL